MSGTARTAPLPLFPLENVVLFPHVQVPLHIFEPRYRQMAQAALDGDRCIGMVTVRPEFAADMQGSPPVFSIGCEGEIERAEKLEDGRFNLLLRGTHRFRILAEEPPEGERHYRRARVEQLDDDESGDPQRVLELRGQTYEMMRDLIRIVAPNRLDIFEEQPFAQLDDVTFVNSVSQSMDFGPSEKQGLLEADAVVERYERLEGLMRFRLAELSTGGVSGPDILQ